MKVLLLGADGYIGWPLTVRLASVGHTLLLVDNLSTRRTVRELGGTSVIPIAGMPKRLATLHSSFPESVARFIPGDITRFPFLEALVREFKPDAVVNLAQQPRAPYSMIGPEEAWSTLSNNTKGTLNLLYAVKRHAPGAHILHMGTMGEYGTPNYDIEEGFMEVLHKGRSDRVPLPRMPQSFYHVSKVSSSHLAMLANHIWKVTCTNIMQGIVYGSETEEQQGCWRLATRLDVDATWGTLVHRHCAEIIALGHIIIYGSGQMIRGFLSLEDSVSCLKLLLDNPPAAGTYRVVNQLDEILSTLDVAQRVEDAARRLGLSVGTRLRVPDPRVESQGHYYNAVTTTLRELGFSRKRQMADEIEVLLRLLFKHRGRIPYRLLSPNVFWRRTRNSAKLTAGVP